MVMRYRLVFLAILFLAFFSLNEALARNIVLKLILVNPSKKDKQVLTVREYLPKEVKPEDIVDKGGFEVGYDAQQGSYFIYGDFELKPAEVSEKEIEVRDIWVIPAADIESVRVELSDISKLLKGTDYADRFAFLGKSIEDKINQITEMQENPPTNPERYISAYRENLKLLEQVREDLIMGRSFLTHTKAMPSTVVWKAIFAIMIFLALLGLSFYFIWHRQVKILTGDNTFVIPEEDKASTQDNQKTQPPAQG